MTPSLRRWACLLAALSAGCSSEIHLLDDLAGASDADAASRDGGVSRDASVSSDAAQGDGVEDAQGDDDDQGPGNSSQCSVGCGPLRFCKGGKCACLKGLTRCEGACTDLTQSAEHCGACGNACGADALCVAGACAKTAPATSCSACPCAGVCGALLGPKSVCCKGPSGPFCVNAPSCP